MRREFGDFQTPAALVGDVLRCLRRTKRRWTRVLEPTCGKGSFINGLLQTKKPPQEIRGFELQESYVKLAASLALPFHPTAVVVQQANLFELDLRRDLQWKTEGDLLVIGNPPWVTNAELGALGSRNLPHKSNLKRLAGLEALTGSANFDIAEFIWLKLIFELAEQKPAIALLCKTSVARNVLQFARDNSLAISNVWLRRIDAKRYFNAAVDACLFHLQVGRGKTRYEAQVFADLQAAQPETVLSFAGHRLIASLADYEKVAFLEGECPLIWRQGIKHDAASVMELRQEGKRTFNQSGEAVEIEAEYLYPLVKGRALFHPHAASQNLQLIVTQKRIGEDTLKLQRLAPRLWDYLNQYAEAFERRKSSIYRRRSPFAIFGVGEYAFAPFKVAVSGLHPEPRFRLLAPVNRRPVMLDDTSYFLPCHSLSQAALLMALLQHPLTMKFLCAAMFTDAKRPITKRLLQRIALHELVKRLPRDELLRGADDEWKKVSHQGMPVHNVWPDDLSSLLR